MASSIVVKVRYGETLRRFNANLNEAGQLELNIGGLREKILGLFNLAPNSDITITYTDEDDDVVTLVDEEDLRDVITQSLNPLYLTVKCNTENVGNVRSSESSTPMSTPRVQQPLENLNNNVSELLKPLESLNNSVSELLKSVPEPFREPISKLSLGLTTKAATGVPGLADLVDSLTKMGQLAADGSKSRDVNVASGSGKAGSQPKMPGTSRADKAPVETAPETKSDEQTAKANRKEDVGTVADGPASNPSNASAGLSFVPWLPTDAKNVASQVASGDSSNKVGKTGERRVKAGKSVNSTAGAVLKDAKKSGKEWSYFTTGVYPASAGLSPMVGSGTSNVGGGITQFPDLNVASECPFTGTLVQNDSAVSGPPRFQPQFGARGHPFKRTYNNNDGLGSIFHRGVRCDGCGVHPITGPRFKSKVKDDYDLCSVCFSQLGNAMDYIRMDRPASYHHPHSFKGTYEQCLRSRIPTLPQVVRGAGLNPNLGLKPSLGRKLDSRFVKDVNVLDGTIMAPSTPFTKIWQMKNNGSLPWPRGSQLVWIGGDNLSDAQKVELQIQTDEVAVDGKLDVAVDFTAPKNPGRYISYWRMASPSGQKFGQRVWVLIQVDSSLEESLLDSFQGLNLNMPPEGSNEASPEYQNPKSEPVVSVESANVNKENEQVEPLIGASSDRATEPLEPLIGANSGSNTEAVKPLIALAPSHSIYHGSYPSLGERLFSAPPAKPEAPKAVAYPIVDSSVVEQAESSNAASASNEVPVTAVEGDLERSLLKELEDMGFAEPDLNKQVLRMNGFDLEKSVDYLCGVSEWDPMLEELKEMGFNDEDVNRRLLKKNNGSIKGVVMDLITGEKDD